MQIRIVMVGGSMSTKGSGSALRRIGDGFTNKHVFKATNPDDVAGRGFGDFDFRKTLVTKKGGYRAFFLTSVGVER